LPINEGVVKDGGQGRVKDFASRRQIRIRYVKGADQPKRLDPSPFSLLSSPKKKNTENLNILITEKKVILPR